VDVIDKLIEEISLNLVDDRPDLSQAGNHDNLITKKILASKKSLIKLIYTFKG
jgi:hypothetical protein